MFYDIVISVTQGSVIVSLLITEIMRPSIEPLYSKKQILLA